MNFKDNKYFKLWIKNSWPYLVGAVLLSVFQIVTLVTTNSPWGITKSFAYWGAWIYRSIGGNVNSWYYFSDSSAQSTLNSGFLNDPGSIQNLGIILGAFLASLLASQFKIKKINQRNKL